MVLPTIGNRNAPSSSPKQKPLSPRAVTWLLLKPEEKLKPNEQEYVNRLCEQSPTMSHARDLILRFFDLVRTRSADELSPWLSQAEACGIASLRQFAIGLRRDLKAVIPALTMEWSNGQVEGFVNKIKFIKRSMYGRASFDLFKAKVIASSVD